jgi:putative endopeptidase
MPRILYAMLIAVMACVSSPSRGQSLSSNEALTALPYRAGLDVDSIDTSADPCIDFYQYSCGGWMKTNPIPHDQASWSVYRQMYENNQRFLLAILTGLARNRQGRTATQQKLGDYFAACMDEAAIERQRAVPIRPYLHRVAAMKSKAELPRVLAYLQLRIDDKGLFFGIDSNPDFADAERVIAFAGSGGLGLPDRDYYLMDDDRSKMIRAAYVTHVARMLRLLGARTGAAAREADTVMGIETALARASLSRVDRRDPYKLFHKLDAHELQALMPTFDWDRYLEAIGLRTVGTFNVAEPAFYRELDHVVDGQSLGAIKIYLRWQIIRATAPFLSSAFVDENFAFYGTTLRGVPRLQPRWKRCVTLVDEQLGEALGKAFVDRAFNAGLKEKALEMTRQIEQAMRAEIAGLDWMSATTRQKALEKLGTVANKIGYPDRWRDYGTMQVRRADFMGNVERARSFDLKRRLAKIGKPLDRGEWRMTPSTVNAYYDPQLNDINFPAAVLQPPLYDPKMDDASNYGNTGSTIGHELTHAFDDEGRQFDARGNLADWWTDADAKAFNARAQCTIDQYAQYPVVDDIRINSKLTAGEDIADLGGLILGWMAWKAQMPDASPPMRDGLTPPQRFFIGSAQWACENNRPENLRVNALTDPHSPGRYRINGAIANMPEFAQAFGCTAGQPMVRANACRVW